MRCKQNGAISARSRDPELIPPEQILAVLRKDIEHSLPSSANIIDGLIKAGLQPPAAELLYYFYGHPSEEAQALRQRMVNESVPSAVEIQEFTLYKPQTLMLMNGSYQIYEVSNGRGRLLRFSDNWAPTPHEN